MSLFKFTWSFTINYHPTEFSCIAVSEESARAQILEQLAHISAASTEYRSLRRLILSQCDESNIEQLRERDIAETRFNELKNSFKVDAFIGCYTQDLGLFTEESEVYTKDGDTTLKEYIVKSSPTVTPFYNVSLRSCLDG
jgi:hypothetical protein